MSTFGTKISVLTIAGSDSCGGAGIQADIKTFAAIGLHGSCVITSITSQNTKGVKEIFNLPLKTIENQLKSILEDLNIRYIKIGMLSSPEIVSLIATLLLKYNLKNVILDPVMVAESGGILLEKAAINVLKQTLLPKIYILTPNIMEAEILADMKIKTINQSKIAAYKISMLGIPYVIIKGGHLNGIDLLYDSKSKKYTTYKSHYINNKHGFHGTGCTYSSAIASYLSLGYTIEKSCKLAKNFVSKCIVNAEKVGHGSIPVNQTEYLLKCKKKIFSIIKKFNNK